MKHSSRKLDGKVNYEVYDGYLPGFTCPFFLDNAHYECQSLQTIQGENASLTALAMARNGALDDAVRLLQRYEEHGAMLTKEVGQVKQNS